MEVEKLRSNKAWVNFVRELKRLDVYNKFLVSSEFFKGPITFEDYINSMALQDDYDFLSPTFIINWSKTKDGWSFWNSIHGQIKFNNY